MGQDIFDLVMVLVLIVFAGRGFVHGFVGEIAGIVSLLGGFWAAHNYHAVLAPRLSFVSDPVWRHILAYAALFLGVILLVSLLARLLQKILSFTFVSWADKLAGGLLGLAKGVLLCSLALLALQKLFGDAPFLQHSRVLPYFATLMAQMREWLPPDLLARLGM